MNIALIGAGSWGTALGMVLARNGHQVLMTGRDIESLEQMANTRENTRYLPGIPLPEGLNAVKTIDEALEHADAILVAVPSKGFKDALTVIAEKIARPIPVLWATKGLEPKTGRFLHSLAESILPKETEYAILSGPSFALEVAKGIPTAVVIAGKTLKATELWVDLFHNETFRVYTNTDIIGVQLGGAVKNVLAIATGICDGLGYGANTRAALMARGLAEVQRLALALGANPDTLIGLAGCGDIILTCTDNLSRNRRFGLALGKGMNRHEAEQSIGQVVEGADNVAEVCQMAAKHRVEMPIATTVLAVLQQELSPSQAVNVLFARKPKQESLA